MTLSPDERRALTIIAESGLRGCTEHTLIAHGFTMALLVGLVRAGVAEVSAERVRDGDNVSAVARLHITEEGRATLSVPH